MGFHATAVSSRPHLSFLFGLAHCAPSFWSHFGSADGPTVAHLPDVPIDTAGTGGPIFIGVACGGPSELSPFVVLGFMSSVTCLHGRAILASDAT